MDTSQGSTLAIWALHARSVEKKNLLTSQVSIVLEKHSFMKSKKMLLWFIRF